jgi:hypothetical protein
MIQVNLPIVSYFIPGHFELCWSGLLMSTLKLMNTGSMNSSWMKKRFGIAILYIERFVSKNTISITL